MAQMALYRKWRPRRFDEVVDQEHIVHALRHSVQSGKIAHAYLFCGTRGTGKTTVAKIFANAIACESPDEGNPCGHCAVCKSFLQGNLMDIIEMDAASNNSVETIRRIIDEVVYLPSQAKFKIYIIDEAHMLSPGAFNALLKTLEEPPAHAVFMLATTEAHRIMPTIASRCQRYDFHRIDNHAIVARLQQIATSEGIDCTKSGLEEIARHADGALRDAVSLLDQCRTAIDGSIDQASVRDLIGLIDLSIMGNLIQAMLDQNPDAVLQQINDLVQSGKDIRRFVQDLIPYVRHLMVFKTCQNPQQFVQASTQDTKQIAHLANQCSRHDLLQLMQALNTLANDLKWHVSPRTSLEAQLLGLMSFISPSTQTAVVPTGEVKQTLAEENPVLDSQNPPLPPTDIALESATTDPSSVELDDTAVQQVESETLPKIEKPAAIESNSIPRSSTTPSDNTQDDPDPKNQLDDADDLDDGDDLDEPLTTESDFWQAVLEDLADQDAMVYCFLQPADVTGTRRHLTLHYSPMNRSHATFFREDRGKRPLHEAIKRANHGRDIRVTIDFNKSTDHALIGDESDNWIEKLEAKVQSLGLTLEQETK